MLNVDGDADAAVDSRIRIGWNKFRQLVPLLHGSETWPVRKENEVALQRAEMNMVRWMCNVKLKDRVPSQKLRERLGIDDIILTL